MKVIVSQLISISSLLAETGARDAGLLQATFAVLRETAKPAVLLEMGYMDNPEENKKNP